LRLTVKLGGSILEEASIREDLLRQMATLVSRGHQVLVVHGGGKRLSRLLAKLGIESRFVGGLRVTDAETLSVAVMVLAGEVNKGLVAALGAKGVRAVGLCGADAACLRCDRLTMPADEGGKEEDLGFVGRPTSLDREFFERMLAAGLTPVLASIALGPDGHLYNVNADQMASICAWGAGCEALVYLTDVAGVLDGEGRVIPRLERAAIEDLRRSGIVSGGMLPKTSASIEALGGGVGAVYILPGRSPDVLLGLLDGSPIEGTCIHDGE
jgi:acetylglutamate kinase